MSTAPVTPTPTIVKDITNDLAWIKTHAIILVLVLVLIAGSIYSGVALVENLVQKHDENAAAAQQKIEGVDTATQQALLAQLVQDHADNQARDAQQNALIQSLISQMAQQRAATAKQVTTDSTLDIQSAAQRLSSQTKAAPGDLTVQNNLVTMSLPLTRVVIADLDQYQQAQNDVTNLQAQLGAQQIVTNGANTELSDANKIIQADKIELLATIKADDAACVVKVDAQAAKDRKRGFWATAGGVVLGVILGSRI